MEATEIIRFFLHDKIAAKMWKRTEREQDGIITYQFVSKNSRDYNFEIICTESYKYMWFNHWSGSIALKISSSDITRIRSFAHHLWIDFGESSYILIAYGHKRSDL